MWEDTGPAVFKAAPLSGGAAVQILRHRGLFAFFLFCLSLLDFSRHTERENTILGIRYAKWKRRKKERSGEGGSGGCNQLALR